MSCSLRALVPPFKALSAFVDYRPKKECSPITANASYDRLDKNLDELLVFIKCSDVTKLLKVEPIRLVRIEVILMR